jgi:small subunit ribosomal protein S13
MQVSGFEIQNKKKIIYSLTSIYGLEKNQGLRICYKLNLNPKLKWEKLTKNEQIEIIDFIERTFVVGEKKKKENNQQIKLLQQNGSYRGFRHRNALPVNGQRTHSNARSYKRLRSIIKSKKKK